MTATRALLAPGTVDRAARLRAEIALTEEIILDCAEHVARQRHELEELMAVAADEDEISALAGSRARAISEEEGDGA